MSKKFAAPIELRQLLENGYEMQNQLGAHKVFRVPRGDELGVNKNSFRDYLRQGAGGMTIYSDFSASIGEFFDEFGLSIARFKNKTQSIDPTIDADSPAALLGRQLAELDRIVNDPTYFETYVVPGTHSVIRYDNGILSQGHQEHKFRDPQYKKLIELLWSTRTIVSPKGAILDEGRSTPRIKVRAELNVNHQRFKDIVRGIEQSLDRKNIALCIKYPKDVQLIVTQDSM